MDVDLLTDFEQGSGDNIASFQFGCFTSVDAEFAQHGASFDASFGVVTRNSFGHAGGATLTECDLNSGVTICFRGFDLCDTVVRHVQNGDRDRVPFIRKDAHHSNLATEKA
ncbi:hypothetical protein BN2497_8367 [Janthinobacterium sp. CG23_2]|nr:hypothetical protein BN2497_8367 [Janthinobacterium sp. CG23_2]CUU30581.1 hypothetical protein BN3177_8367 [Janthinobacterium sp. CG23_2]